MPSPKIFQRTTRAKKDGTCPLYLQMVFSRKVLRLPIGLSIKIEDFDKVKGLVKSSHPNSSDFNLVIGQALAKANSVLVTFRLQGRTPTLEAFKTEWNTPGQSEDFLEFFRRECLDQYHKKAISLGTYRYHERASRQLAKFMETRHRYQSLPYSMMYCRDFTSHVWAVG